MNINFKFPRNEIEVNRMLSDDDPQTEEYY